jgi:hypothetical protein
MYQSATNWLFTQLWEEPKDKFNWYAIRKIALQMEERELYETQAYWFGRGVLAGKEDRIEELKPKNS